MATKKKTTKKTGQARYSRRHVLNLRFTAEEKERFDKMTLEADPPIAKSELLRWLIRKHWDSLHNHAAK